MTNTNAASALHRLSQAISTPNQDIRLHNITHAITHINDWRQDLSDSPLTYFEPFFTDKNNNTLLWSAVMVLSRAQYEFLTYPTPPPTIIYDLRLAQSCLETIQKRHQPTLREATDV